MTRFKEPFQDSDLLSLYTINYADNISIYTVLISVLPLFSVKIR